jgi:hypothetical protein
MLKIHWWISIWVLQLSHFWILIVVSEKKDLQSGALLYLNSLSLILGFMFMVQSFGIDIDF